MEYLPYFLFTFDELGRMGLDKGKGRFQLESAFGVGPEGEGEVARAEWIKRLAVRDTGGAARFFATSRYVTPIHWRDYSRCILQRP
jgi:hypothetical protein